MGHSTRHSTRCVGEWKRSRSQIGLNITKERHAIRVKAIEQDRAEQDRKNGCGLARGARYPNHPNQARGRFGENDQRGKATVITTTTASEEATETTGRTASEAKVGAAATGRATTNADRPNGGLGATTLRPNGGPGTTTLTETGDARITHTAATGAGSS